MMIAILRPWRTPTLCLGLLASAAFLTGTTGRSTAACVIPASDTHVQLAPAVQARLIVLVNNFRRAHHLRPLKLDPSGARYALYSPHQCNAISTMAAWKASARVRHVLLFPWLRKVRFFAKPVPSKPVVVVTPNPEGPPNPIPPQPPVAPPPPPAPPATPPTIVGVPYTCSGPVDNVRVVGTGTADTALVNLAAGCTGTISFDLTITAPGGGDGVKVQDGAHDLVVGPSRVTCQPGVPGNMHQDGVQVQGGSNITFNGLAVVCPDSPGAAAFYIDGKNFPGIRNVVCDGCNLEHMVVGALFTAPAPGSGVRNSVIHQGTITSGYYAIVGTGAVDTGNVLAPACDGVLIPC